MNVTPVTAAWIIASALVLIDQIGNVHASNRDFSLAKSARVGAMHLRVARGNMRRNIGRLVVASGFFLIGVAALFPRLEHEPWRSMALIVGFVVPLVATGTMARLDKRERAWLLDESRRLPLDDEPYSALVIADRRNRLIWVSDHFASMLGYRPDELQGKSYLDFVHPDDRPATSDEAADMNVRDAVDFRNRYRTKSGPYVWLRWRAQSYTRDGLTFATARLDGSA